MPNTNPTIVSASLSDKELQDSINKMVANFDKGLQTMLEHSNEYVGKIQASLQKIGDTNFGAKGSNDGGVAKQTKAQNEFTDAVKKSTNEIKRQGKEGEMSFDQIAAALDKARRTVSDFNTKRASGILPSSEDYKRYEQALARIVEYNDKLKQSALSRADANQWANVFDAKRAISDISAVDDRYKKLVADLKTQQAESAKAFNQQMRDAFKMPTANVDEVWKKIFKLRELLDKGTKSEFISSTQIKNVENLISKLHDMRREMESKAVPQSVANYIKNVGTVEDQLKLAFARANKIPTDQLDLAQAKLERLQALLRDMRERGILSNTQIASTEAEIRKLEQIIGQVNTTQQQTTQSAQRYTEEIRKQAQAIRESQQWKEKGFVTVGNDVFYDPARSKAQTLSLEEQMLNAENRRIEAQEKLNAESQKEVEIKSQLPKQGYLFDGNTRDESSRQQQSRAALERYKQIQQEEQNVNSLNAAIMRSLHIGKDEVKNYDIRTASAKQLNAMLKQQRDAYANLTTSQRSQKGGVELAESIQRTVRALQKLQAAASRPISLQFAMGLSEKTLDEMAYKMRQLASYRSGLNIKTQANEIEQVNRKYAELQKSMNDIMRKNTEMIKSNTALGRSWNYMKNRLAFYFTVGASTQFVKNLIEIRSQYEMNERALGILINSAERGTQIFNELSQMALVSPYTLIELSTAAKQLTAYDIAAKDVVDTTRRLADMAAAVGIPIERLTYALGQIKAYGYLNARDARMFSNAGIPLVKQLAEHYTELEGKMVSTADVYDRIKKKAIDMTDVMQVINKMTDEGGKFFDFQAKMAGTLKVQLANLTLAWNNMLNDIGASEQGTISTGIGLLKELFLQWKNISKMVTNLAIGFGVVKAAQLAYYGVVMGTNKAIALETVLGNRLSNSLRSLASSTNAARMSSTALWVGIATFAAAAVVDILRGNEAMKEFNKTLRENAENTYNDLKKFSENYSGLRESLYKTENGKQTPVDINSEEAKKAWEVLREQIELSSHASDEYISKLLSIENVSERLRQGFAVIDSIQAVSAAIKEIGDSAIKLERDWSAWWNLGLLPDGTIGNLQDAYMWLSKIEEKYGSVVNARKVASTSRTDEGLDNVFQDEAKEFVENYETELEKFRKDLQVTKQSIIDFIELKGWSGDTSKINEVFKTFTDNLILKNQLNPQQAYTLQLEMEEARSKAAKEALLQRINDERAALKISHDDSVREALAADIERYKNWDKTNGRSKVEWERFTKWLKEQHISETTAMFRNMDAEDIRSLNFQEGKHAEWVKRMVTQYAKEHKMSYDDAFGYLKSWVTSANQWSIFIPMTISTEDSKTVYKQLGEYDKAIDDADAQIERLTKRINELNAKKKKSKEETKELGRAEQELADAQKAKADAEAKGGHGKKEKKEEKAANKAAKQSETELQKALKDELSTIDKVRSIYKDLTKEGMSHANAVERATRGWDETVNAINRVLQKNGLQKLDLSKFAGIENPRELVNMLQSQLNTLLKHGAKPAEIKELQTKIQTLNVDAEKYDLTKITKGLNNELGKLKDEYELAVELDADPELGNAFASMMGIDMESLPHTVKEYADQYSKYLNKYLKGKNSAMQLTGDELRGMTRDDINALQSQVNAGTFNQEWFDAIKKAYDDIQGKRKKDIEDTEKWKNSLIEKYGNLQDKLTKIYKDSVQNQVNAVKTFGTEDQKSDIVRLQLRLEATDNPAELTEINTEIAKIVKDVTDKNPIALKLVTASDNQTKADESKAYWEDFKNSELYAMTFEDMANNSTRAIQLIMDKLEGLKDKVKEDPASMKALIKSLEDAQKELNARDPFGGVARSLRDMAAASRETKAAQEALWRAEVDVEQAQQEVDNSEDGTPEEQADAQQKLSDAVQRRAAAQVKLTQAENKGKKAQENLKSSLQGMSNQLGDVQGLFGVVSKLFRAGGDDETADAIDAISEGFSIMTTVIMGVVAAMILLESSQPWLLAIAAALSVIVGLVSFLSGNENKKIDAKIKESELAVKRLELAYIDLEHAINQAYGMATIGAQKAAIANKELQLVELKRQLALERSRDSKHKDEDRIVELRKQIKELEYDIRDSMDAIVNDLLGISSVGDALENMMSSIIDTFRQGSYKFKDIMKDFKLSINDMIANMVMKMYTTKILQPWFENVWNTIQGEMNERGKEISEEIKSLQSTLLWVNDLDDDPFGDTTFKFMSKRLPKEMQNLTREQLVEYLEDRIKELEQEFSTTTAPTANDIKRYAELLRSGSPIVEENLKGIEEFLRELGLLNDKKTTSLSALQQGIQGITEDTAGALEAYMNGVSQQVYLQSRLITEIRDAIVGFDLDVQVATMGQMLLQLQASYQVQMSIQGILEGVLNPSGRAFNVELIS